MPHPLPDRVAAVDPRLLIHGKSLLISQKTSMSRGRSTIRPPVDEGGSSYSSAPPNNTTIQIDIINTIP